MAQLSREMDVIADAPAEVKAAAGVVHSWITQVEKSRRSNVYDIHQAPTLKATPPQILAVAGTGAAIDCYRRVTFFFKCSPMDAVRALERLSSGEGSPLGWNRETKTFFRR